jgi:hypothetical protein
MARCGLAAGVDGENVKLAFAMTINIALKPPYFEDQIANPANWVRIELKDGPFRPKG